jgi:outer membrane protein assembly factor BamB
MREAPPPSHLDFTWLPYLTADDEGHVYVLGPAAHGSLSMKAGHGALAKLNPDGQIDWRLDVLPTAPTMDAITVSPNGESIYLVGNPSGTSRVVIQKVDARGRQQWLRQFDGPWRVVPFVDEHAVASAPRMRVRRRLVSADDNTVYVALDTAPTFLVAFDGHNGDLKWVRQYGILPFPYAAPTHLRLMSNGEIGIGLMMRGEERRVHGMFRIQRNGKPVP